MAITINKKINLIIPKRCNHNLIIPNYSNLNYNLIIPKIMIVILLFQIFEIVIF